MTAIYRRTKYWLAVQKVQLAISKLYLNLSWMSQQAWKWESVRDKGSYFLSCYVKGW